MPTRPLLFALALAISAFGCASAEGDMNADDTDGETTGEETAAITSHPIASAEVQPGGFKYRFQNWDHDGKHVDNPVSILFVSAKPNLVERVYDQLASVNENTPKADFGYQDQARSLLVDKMVTAKKWRVLQSVDVQNACDERLDAKHLCKHDGKALVVSID
jgi:hypothetical protein